MRPGTQVLQRETPPARSAPTDTSVWFVAGTSDRGPSSRAELVTNLGDFERIFGARQSYSVLYDALDAYFHEGGGRAYVSRVVGPAATIATRNLLDAGAGVSLVASAIGPGASYHTIEVGVRAGSAGGTYVLFVEDNNIEVETSPDLTTQADAINWALTSDYIRIALGATANPPAVAAAAALAGGADDRLNATDANWEAALGRFASDLGPGQVSMPGRTTSQAHIDTLEHALASNRVALLDAPDSATVATLVASANAARTNGRRGAMFAPWGRIPGLLGGTYRTVPPSALAAGAIARSDVAGNSPNLPAAGDNGQLLNVIDLTQPAWTDAERNTLNNAGVNAIRAMYGGVRIYGWRSLANPVSDPSWRNFGHARLYMGIASLADEIAEHHAFREIDGRGVEISSFGADLTAMLLDFYTAGSLYGATPGEAFFVDVGPNVNTPQTLADDELRAIVSVRMSPHGELVTIEIVKRPITEAVV